ncbi:MAG TPA: MmcQ/YjbR family DNA-binding protein [Devosia sp.]|nr:MmcQ/YjbR family DNA-binding protein [Devosia sp.]
MSSSGSLDIFQREGFESFISSLPAVTIAHQWGGSSVGKVGGKIFALYTIWNETDEWRIAFKCSDMSFEMLPELQGIYPAKYLARAKWVDVSPTSELNEDDVRAYITEAHRLVAAKLTQKLKQELGLSAQTFNPKKKKLDA